MRKLLCFIIAFTLIIPSCLCGTAYAQDDAVWVKAFYTDVFGDPTDDYYLTNSNHFSGTYNSATVNKGNLYADIIVERDGESLHFFIVLLENGTEQIKNGTGFDLLYDITVKKTDGSKFTAEGVLEKGADRIAVPSSADLSSALSSVGTISIYLAERGKATINNYLFNVPCANFTSMFASEILAPYSYERAEKLKATGELNEAFEIFESLGDYRDSKEQANAIIDIQDKKYEAAEASIQKGNLGLAAYLFWQLGDYRDARQRSLELQEQATSRKTIAAGGWHTVGVKEDGTVVGVGSNDDKQCSVSKWSDIIAIDASDWHTVGLKSDGTVVATGENDSNQCNVSGWHDIIAVAAGNDCTLGLKSNGTVVYTGDYYHASQRDFSNWKNIISISVDDYLFSNEVIVGLQVDGTVLVKDSNTFYPDAATKWKNIVAVDARYDHIVGLKADGTVVDSGADGYDVSDWKDIVAIAAGYQCTIGLKADGTVVVAGTDRFSECAEWTDIVTISAAIHHVVGLKSDGTTVVVGENMEGECNVTDWTRIKLPNS